jgi:probable HAF family extracellular repeat protein
MHHCTMALLALAVAASPVTAQYTIVDLGTLGGTTSFGNSINAAGQVGGTAAVSGGQLHAMRWTPGAGMQDLGVFPGGGTTSAGYAINASGLVAGDSETNAGGNAHAALWSAGGGPPLDLGTLGGVPSYSWAINSSGQVAGSSVNATGQTRAYLWTSGGTGGPRLTPRCVTWAASAAAARR